MAETTRTFAAFEIGDSARDAIAGYAGELRRRPDGGDLRWVRPENLHMTVRFFGDLDRKRLERAREAIRRLDGEWDSPTDLSIGRLGAFPSPRRPQVLWIGVEDPAGAFARLAADADRAIRTVGFGQADKPFVGHLTIARVGRGKRPPDLGLLTAGLTEPEGPLTIRSITLFRSDLRPEGPLYTALEVARPRSDPGGMEAAP